MISPGGEHCGKCGRGLARPTNFCPFCGSNQLAADAIQTENEATVSAIEEIDHLAPGQEITPIAPSEIAKEAAEEDTRQDTKLVPPSPQPNLAKPLGWWASGRTLAITVGCVVGLVLLLVLIESRGNSVTVAAAPDHWTPVDISRFPNGTRVVIFARGAFRVRSLSTAPVLVDGEGGDVELSDLPRTGLEIRSASGSPLDVKLSSVKK